MSIFDFLFKPNIEKLKARGDVQALIKALRYKNQRDEQGSMYVRAGAARALGELGDSRAVEPLITALKDENAHVRRRATWALGELGDPRAVEPLRVALKDEDETVRADAATALEKLGNARAVEPLRAALEDEDSRKPAETRSTVEYTLPIRRRKCRKR